MDKVLHIVSLDVPMPPDYGAAIDIYYRCKALKEAGFHITLHCFEYGRGAYHDHSAIADRVIYYKRRKTVKDWLSSSPFIVRSRASKELLHNLLADNHPVLFEGQHTTHWLGHPALYGRKKMVRIHNIEWQYYAQLAEKTKSALKRIYYRSESRKLKAQEPALGNADVLACISHTDVEYYKNIHRKVVYLPAGVELETLPPDPKGYVLLHGNLGVEENHEAAIWTLEVFRKNKLTLPLVIAGKSPSEELRKRANEIGVTLIANPGREEMEKLIREASVHVLISFQHSGTKLKLLKALNSGIPCVATPEMVEGTTLGNLCRIVSNEQELVDALGEIQPYSEEEVGRRRAVLQEEFGPLRVVSIVEGWLK